MRAVYNMRVQCFVLAVAAIILSASGCAQKEPQSNSDAKDSTSSSASGQISDSPKVADKPLKEFQVQLLEYAFDIASTPPSVPYKKLKSKIQQGVVKTCLRMDQPVRSVTFASKIENWRMGLAYADVAFYLAENKYPFDKVQVGLDLAEQIAKLDHGQKWRNDMINTRIAQTYYILCQEEKAKSYLLDVGEKEKAAATIEQTQPDSDISLEEKLQKIELMFELKDFQVTNKALFAFTDLYNQYYDQPEKRDVILEKLNLHSEATLGSIRFKIITVLANIAIDHSDYSNATNFVDEAIDILDKYQWDLNQLIPNLAKVSEIEFLAKNPEKALIQLNESLRLYDEHENEIPDMFRAETLCPVAEVFQQMGNTDKALEIYKRAVEAGTINPNQQQCAEDISAVCCSMAEGAAEPDPELLQRLQQIIEELKKPW